MKSNARQQSEDFSSRRRRLTQALLDQADDISRITAGLDETSLAKRVEVGKWSLKELVAHLLRVQQVFEGRVVAMVTEDNPAVTPYDPDGDPAFAPLLDRQARELIVSFVTNRDLFVGQLMTFSDAEWQRAGRHPEIPGYNVETQVEHMVYHEAHHIYQMLNRRALLRQN